VQRERVLHKPKSIAKNLYRVENAVFSTDFAAILTFQYPDLRRCCVEKYSELSDISTGSSILGRKKDPSL